MAMLAWRKRVPQPPGRPGGHQMPIRESPNARALSGCLIPYRSHHVGHIILVGWLAVRGSLKTRRAHKRAQTTGGMWCAQAGNKPRPTWKLARADTARGHRGHGVRDGMAGFQTRAPGICRRGGPTVAPNPEDFRSRLDRTLQLRDPQALRAFLVAEGQWKDDVTINPERAMWMMIASSPALRDQRDTALRWLSDHGFLEEAGALSGDGGRQTSGPRSGAPHGRGGGRRGQPPTSGRSPRGGHRSRGSHGSSGPRPGDSNGAHRPRQGRPG